MTVDFISLAVITCIAAFVPIIARMIPHRLIPEAVFLLLIGALCGPYCAGFIHVDDTVLFLSDLGLAFLFLLAGFEIEPKKIVGPQGRHGLITWVVTMLAAAFLVWIIGLIEVSWIEAIVVAIAMTTTALGTLLPILAERKLLNTAVGDAVLAYGTWGELGPVLAMAFLLSARSTLASFLVLLALLALCVAVVLSARGVKRYGRKIFEWVNEASQTTSQAYVRNTVFLLILLLAAASIFKLDLVLGAFAAGFVLRQLVPEENTTLELKLNGMAHGFFIPLFFVVSGAEIDLASIGAAPLMLLAFMGLLLVIRGVPILAAQHLSKHSRNLNFREKVSVSLYCTTALPLIVALTSVAMDSGDMSPQVASALVAAGALTVLLMPLLALFSHGKKHHHR